jgi:hypothetical protein
VECLDPTSFRARADFERSSTEFQREVTQTVRIQRQIKITNSAAKFIAAPKRGARTHARYAEAMLLLFACRKEVLGHEGQRFYCR